MKISFWSRLLLVATLFTTPAFGKQVTIYVSTTGKDTWTGQLSAPAANGQDGPLATLPAALNKVRSLRQANAGDSYQVSLRDGVYRLSEPLVLIPQDSGVDSSKPLIISAFEKEVPVITAHTPITGWKRVDSNRWEAQIPEVKEGKWYFRELFVNGERRTRARTEGFLHIDGESPSGKPAKFKFHPGDIKKQWAGQDDIEVVALLAWADFRLHIREVDEEKHVVTLSDAPADSNRESNAQYYIENSPDLLDQPGEWYLDRKNGVLTYLAKQGEDLTKLSVDAPRLQQLVLFKGEPQKPVCNIVLRGLTFSGTDWDMKPTGYVDVQAAFAVASAVEAKWLTNCAFRNCKFTQFGGHAIDFGRGCRYDSVVGCDISDIGGGGLRIGEPNVPAAAEDANNHHTITDNHIYQLGRVFAPAVGVFILQSGQNNVAHNHIHDLFYTAISVGWNWGYQETPCRENIIEYNDLHDIGQSVLSDMGGIYTLGIQQGTVIRNNLVHDVRAYTYGGWGLYTDEGSTGILLENNVVYNCKSAGFHQHYGRENVLRNNIFAFNAENQLMRTRAEPHTSFIFTNNIVIFNKGNLLGSDWSNDHYVMDYNIFWDIRPNAKISFSGANLEEWRKRGHDVHSLITAPMFFDAAKRDFRLKPESPALGLGFRPIDLSKVGPRTNAQ